MTEELLLSAGFEPCTTPPLGWHDRKGTIYTRQLPQGRAYAHCPAETPGLVEAFVGEWQKPLAYCRGIVRNAEQLLWLLA